MDSPNRERIGVVGLGYVGLPLAAAFARHADVLGFDANADRVAELQSGQDHTREVDPAALRQPTLRFTADPADLADRTFHIVAVPTPINASHEPDLAAVEAASRTVGSVLRKGAMVVYESTVYPGVTEEVCLPLLEGASGLRLGDFDLGYSPERVNPGDRDHTLETIVKIVSGHDPAALDRAAAAYGLVVRAGIHRAPSIKTAEAAKVIENVQRDLNIALMNELSKIFHLMGLSTRDVLEAAGTKWNFHRYHPGLVGGHCIGVDPYYLTHRAVSLGYHPEVILAGRRINDNMGNYVGDLVIRELNAAGVLPRDAHVWVLGLTFKENVPDFRNTRSTEVVKYLQGFGTRVSVWEPLIGPDDIRRRFGLESLGYDEVTDVDAAIVINGHDAFRCIELDALRDRMRTPILMDVKNFFDRGQALEQGFRYLAL